MVFTTSQTVKIHFAHPGDLWELHPPSVLESAALQRVFQGTGFLVGVPSMCLDPAPQWGP
jgi:hypothetical protein